MYDFGRRTLSKSTVKFMDGTFKTVPEQFSQLYMVFGSGGESSRIYPSAYMLLPNKRSVTYSHALEMLMRETNSAPISIAIDFEQAVIRASRNVFPNVAIQGCVFYWKKNLFSHVGKKGCLRLFYEEENFQIGLDLIYTLCFVPPGDILFAWETVVEIHFDKHFKDDENVEDFLSYFVGTYIGEKNNRTGNRKDPMFPVSMWNIHGRIVQGQPATNNAVESWNARWNQSMGTNHNIWRVITGFKVEDSLARTEFMEQVTQRNIDPNPGRSSRRSGRMNTLKLSLEHYDRNNIKEFLYGLRGDVI